MLFDFRESVENVSFYFHNVSNKFCYSHRVSESLKVIFTVKLQCQ